MTTPDLLEAAKAIGPYLRGDYFCDATFARAFDSFKRAISAEKARRSQPAAVDPRDAEIAKLRAQLGRCETALVPLTEYPARVGIFRTEDRDRIAAALAALRAAGVEPAPAQEVKASRPAPVRHGETCEKAAHSRTGYLHDENDDTPYDVDGLLYCGRCHASLR